MLIAIFYLGGAEIYEYLRGCIMYKSLGTSALDRSYGVINVPRKL